MSRSVNMVLAGFGGVVLCVYKGRAMCTQVRALGGLEVVGVL